MTNDRVGMGYDHNINNVHCEDCIHLRVRVSRLTTKMRRSIYTYHPSDLICVHANNMKFEDRWLRKNPSKKIYVTSPKVRNRNNTCEDFIAED